MSSNRPELRVGAHVLIQLGGELVTDVEQAILECVKNAYDADSPSCKIEIDTREIGTRVELAPAIELRKFTSNFETVEVELCDSYGQKLSSEQDIDDNEIIQRHLKYTGRVTIEDKGDGLTTQQLRDSWLVISRSQKRSELGSRKEKTKKGRTPLGDKGLGRLGSMKLGDILLIETSTSPDRPITSAEFRWTDCEAASTIDEIPVFMVEHKNPHRFKGTRVSILGLRDLPEWRRKDRISEITRSLAKLISPFESTSTFPVGISLDGVDQSLVSVTEEVLKRAIAKFTFYWDFDEKTQKSILSCKAYFKRRLFTFARSQKQTDRTNLVFGDDNGEAFIKALATYPRLKGYQEKNIDQNATWFIELSSRYQWSEMLLDNGAEIRNPGPFEGAFYFFHLDNINDQDEEAAAGIGIDRSLIKGMTGISLLRDGFRVRSQGDWLGISAGMTSGSTYNMRVENTVGYFALTGEHNYHLIEKSDREGFVEDATYRGFMQIATRCKDFANDALENVRRGLDDYYRKQLDLQKFSRQGAGDAPVDLVKQNMAAAQGAKLAADKISETLHRELALIENSVGASSTTDATTSQALRVANKAVAAMEDVKRRLESHVPADLIVRRIQEDLDAKNEQITALFESAAVGLSARGLAHELRTHLMEIRQQTRAIEKAKIGSTTESSLLAPLRAIRGSCSAIASAAALIDPMLPRTRAIKEIFSIREFIDRYIENRKSSFDRLEIQTIIVGKDLSVKINRPRLLQVLDNLVQNSMYWLRRGILVGDTSRKKVITFEIVSNGFIISDTGPGVDPRYEESLFEIFVSGKQDRDSGQGLGLFIVTQLLGMDGCDIRLLENRNSEGRRFRFAINLAAVIAGS